MNSKIQFDEVGEKFGSLLSNLEEGERVSIMKGSRVQFETRKPAPRRKNFYEIIREEHGGIFNAVDVTDVPDKMLCPERPVTVPISEVKKMILKVDEENDCTQIVFVSYAYLSDGRESVWVNYEEYDSQNVQIIMREHEVLIIINDPHEVEINPYGGYVTPHDGDDPGIVMWAYANAEKILVSTVDLGNIVKIIRTNPE